MGIELKSSFIQKVEAGKDMKVSQLLVEKTFYVFDLDGVVYMGDHVIPGAADFIRKATVQRKNIAYVTNNSGSAIKSISSKLEKMGIEVEGHALMSSGSALVPYLQSKFPQFSKVFVIGTEAMKHKLTRTDYQLVDPDHAEACILAMDPHFNVEMMNHAASLLRAGVPTIALNRDPFFPVGEGKFRAGCGALVRAVETTAGRNIDLFVGKPEVFMLESLCRTGGFKMTETVVFGDTYESDIAMAEKAGASAIYLANGSAENPDYPYRFNSLAEILDNF